MEVPVCEASAESTVKGSRFLAEIFPIESQASVREKLKAQKQKYADATHVVHAFITGKNAEVMGMSDDGEPGGTAGRPVLDVLKGRGVTNILLTVTRWFGGTLLGTGGLVHAYGDAAKLVLDAGSFESLVERTPFSIATDYSLYQVVKKLLADFPVSEVTEDFSETIVIRGLIESESAPAFCTRIFDATSGRNEVTLH